MRMRTRAESACLQVYRAWRKCILPCPGCAQLNFRFARTLGRWAGPFLWILIKIHFVSCRLKLRTVFLGCRKPPHNWLVMWVGPPLDGWVGHLSGIMQTAERTRTTEQRLLTHSWPWQIVGGFPCPCLG